MAGMLGQMQGLMAQMAKAMQPPPAPQMPTPPPPMSPATKEVLSQPGAPPLEVILAMLTKARGGS